jgi:hypothetical protein
MVRNNTVAKTLHLRRLATEGLISEDLAAASAEGEVNNMLQSQEEVLRIADEFLRNFRPSNLVPSAANAEKILSRCLNVKGLVSISYMTESAQELAAAGQLELYPEPQQPKPPTAEELAAKEIARQHRDYIESIKPQPSFEDRVKAEKAKRQAVEAEKAQENAKAQLAVEISGYQCYRGPNQIDYPANRRSEKGLEHHHGSRRRRQERLCSNAGRRPPCQAGTS